MHKLASRLRQGLVAALTGADALFNRLYGWQHNPLYHSGALVVALLLVLVATGLYLTIFYRVGAPYESVARLTDQVWLGRWIRSLHRYAADAVIVAALIHALRMLLQGRRWGARSLAWISGMLLLGLMLFVGWTGYVMVWDGQGQLLAVEGARLMDLLPIFAEPISRTFVGERPLPDAFFFLNLFLHLALPMGLGLLIWIHTSRLARPGFLPPRRLGWGTVLLLVSLAVVWPVEMAPPADLMRLPGRASLDLFYVFWLPLTARMPVVAVWAVGLLLNLVFLGVPWWSRPPVGERPLPSAVDEGLCTGCEQCFLDCPYEAITMVGRADGREGLVARVNPGLCVGCGICTGSCAPMGVGPPGRTGRDQLAEVRALARGQALPAGVVLVACDRGVGAGARDGRLLGGPALTVQCAGNLHTSTIELLLRLGAGGVLVTACPPRDCWNRQGARWLEARMYHDREAELHERVDLRRVRLVYAARSELGLLRAELRDLRRQVEALSEDGPEEAFDLVRMCDRQPEEVGA